MLIYDVEVVRGPDEVEGGWENPWDMGFSSAVIYESQLDVYIFFLHEKGRQQLIQFLRGRKVISFNGIKFDSRVVLGNNRIVDKDLTYTIPFLEQNRSPNNEIIGWYNLDLFLMVVQAKFGLKDIAEAEAILGQKEVHDGSISLDGLSEGTLGKRKIGHGARAPILYQEKRYDELFQYNLHDVRLLRQLWEFAHRNGYLIDRKKNRIKLKELINDLHAL